MIENVDYIRQHILTIPKNDKGGGAKHTIQYTLTSKAFILCLLRSKNSSDCLHVLEINAIYEAANKSKQEKEYERLQDIIHKQSEDCIILQRQLQELQDSRSRRSICI